jgi:N-acetylglucosaminyldiphosphoundecaprenol N-acetyl-beta-D-mannosaminyltransferase
MIDSTSISDVGQSESVVLHDSPRAEANLSCHSGFSSEYADVLGVKISAVDMNSAVNLADRWIAAGNPGYVCVTGAHGVIEAQSDPEFMRILNHAAITVPDGMPMAWVGWLQGHRTMDRVYGPDFMMALCKLSVERGYRNFLYGGKPGVAEQLRKSLLIKFPKLQLVGTYTPPFRALTPEEEEEIVKLVLDSEPHILWVGLGSPKQERFMARYHQRLRVPLLVGVGAAFDFHTGRLQECPDWVKRAGLQWVHRLMQDPKRLWKRYLNCVPAFLWHITLQLSGLRHYPS